MAVENIKILYQLESSDVSELITKLAKLNSEEKELLKNILEVEKQSQKTTQTQAQGFDNLGKIAKNVGAVIVATFAFDKIKDFGNEILKTTSTFQKFDAVLRNTLGSQKRASEAMALIQKFAAETPFSVEQLTDSFVKLANRGFVPTAKEMRSLGDLASSLGKPFDQLTEAILDAMTGEMERLKEFGVKSEKEGDRIKFTFKGVKTEVANTEEAIKKYVLSLGDIKGVAGSMGAISKTLEGQISNLGDTFDQLKLAIGQKLAGAFSWAISGLNGMISAFTNFISPAKNFSQTIQTEREELNLLVRKITDTNTKTDERKQLIQQLQAEYPNFLKNLDAEKVSNEQLADRLRDANKEYKNKLILATSESALQTQAKKLENARREFFEADEAIDKINNQILLKIGNLPQNQQRQLQAIIQGVENDSQALAKKLIRIQNDPMFENLVKDYGVQMGTMERLTPTKSLTEFGELLISLEGNVGKYQNANNTIVNESDRFAKSQAKFNKIFGENNIFTDRTDPKKAAAKTQEVSKAQYEAMEKASKQRADLELRDIEAERKMELQRLEEKKAFNDEILQDSELTEDERIALLEVSYQQEKAIIDLKTNQNLKSFEVVETKLKTHSQFEVKEKQLREKEKLLLVEKGSSEQMEALRKLQSEIFKLEEQKTQKSKEEQRKRREEALKKDEDNISMDTNIALLSELDTMEASKDALQRYEDYKTQIVSDAEQKRRDIKKSFLENELSLLGEEEVDKKKEIADQLFQIELQNKEAEEKIAYDKLQKKVALEQEFEAIKKEINQKAQELVMEIADTYYQIRANNLQKEIEDTQAQKDYDLKMAGDNAEKKAFIESEYNSKLKSLKREQAQQEKEKAIFNIVINTIQGVATAIARAELFPFNFVLAGLIGGMGAAQLVALRSKPVPKFFEGTEYLQRGNNPMGKDTIPIFANEGERIVPTHINDKLKGIQNKDLPYLVRLGLEMKEISKMQAMPIPQHITKVEVTNNVDLSKIDFSKIPQTKNIFDKDGFSEYVVTTNKETKNLNADYSL